MQDARTSLDAGFRRHDGTGCWSTIEPHRECSFVPGMQVNAEIHLGTRSVLEYLLSLVQKVTHEAGRER